VQVIIDKYSSARRYIMIESIATIVLVSSAIALIIQHSKRKDSAAPTSTNNDIDIGSAPGDKTQIK
jgi:hypothetical protein